MSENTRNLCAAALCALAVAITAFFVAPILPLPSVVDFTVLYFAALAKAHGYSWYDTAVIPSLLKANHIATPFVVLPQPYPGWYCLLTTPLGFLSLDTARHVWFALNVWLLAFSALLVTGAVSFGRKAFVLLAVFLFPPTVGQLVVGQFDVPLLCGGALIIFGLRARVATAIAIGGALLTLKPHLGALPLLTSLIASFALDRDFGVRCVRRWVIVISALLALSLAVEPEWPLRMIYSMRELASLSVNVVCDTCSSGVISIAALFALDGPALWKLGTVSTLGGSVLFLCAASPAFRSATRPPPEVMVALAFVVALVTTPYARNYDYILTLVPVLVGATAPVGSVRWRYLLLGWVFLAVATTYGSRGYLEPYLWIGACIMAVGVWLKRRITTSTRLKLAE